MSALRHALEDDLARHRALGCKWHEAHRLLPHCVACLERHGAEFVTTDWAGRWATPPPRIQPAEWARRLRLVRGLAQDHRTREPRTAIPPPAGLPYRHPRRSPSLYREVEIAQLLAAARHLPSATERRAHTDATALGWLAVTGMRISALVAVDNDDVDRGDGRLTLHHTTCGTSRGLPLHPTTRQALCGYVHRRDRVDPIPLSPSVFVSEPGIRLTHWTVRAPCVHLSRQIGWRGPTDSHGPRLHDLRHRFAVQTLVRWSREGVDVARHLPERSTSLGQVKVSDTSWDLRATPEWLGLATQRREQAHRGQTS